MKEMGRVRCFKDSACDRIAPANSAVSLYATQLAKAGYLAVV
jgi:hypothetical protein